MPRDTQCQAHGHIPWDTPVTSSWAQNQVSDSLINTQGKEKFRDYLRDNIQELFLQQNQANPNLYTDGASRIRVLVPVKGIECGLWKTLTALATSFQLSQKPKSWLFSLFFPLLLCVSIGRSPEYSETHSFYFFIHLFLHLHICECVQGGGAVSMSWCAQGVQRKTCESLFCSSMIWVLRIELRFQNLVASEFAR